MSVKSRFVLNEKVEYKYLDENGRPISPLNRNLKANPSQNEVHLKK